MPLDPEKVKKFQRGMNSPRIDPKKAKEIQDSAMESGFQPERWKKNLKEGLGFDTNDDDGSKDEESSDASEEIKAHARTLTNAARSLFGLVAPDSKKKPVSYEPSEKAPDEDSNMGKAFKSIRKAIK